jgi:hypothetical protein
MGVTEVTQPIRLYLDKMIPVSLAAVLRQYGYDVLAASVIFYNFYFSIPISFRNGKSLAEMLV